MQIEGKGVEDEKIKKKGNSVKRVEEPFPFNMSPHQSQCSYTWQLHSHKIDFIFHVVSRSRGSAQVRGRFWLCMNTKSENESNESNNSNESNYESMMRLRRGQLSAASPASVMP